MSDADSACEHGEDGPCYACDVTREGEMEVRAFQIKIGDDTLCIIKDREDAQGVVDALMKRGSPAYLVEGMMGIETREFVPTW